MQFSVNHISNYTTLALVGSKTTIGTSLNHRIQSFSCFHPANLQRQMLSTAEVKEHFTNYSEPARICLSSFSYMCNLKLPTEIVTK